MKFINSLFGEISRMETFFYYYQSLTSIKLKQRMMLFEKIIVFEKSLIDSYNCIFLIRFNLARAELDRKNDIHRNMTQ